MLNVDLLFSLFTGAHKCTNSFFRNQWKDNIFERYKPLGLGMKNCGCQSTAAFPSTGYTACKVLLIILPVLNVII